jgi:hypothetical protein
MPLDDVEGVPSKTIFHHWAGKLNPCLWQGFLTVLENIFQILFNRYKKIIH